MTWCVTLNATGEPIARAPTEAEALAAARDWLVEWQKTQNRRFHPSEHSAHMPHYTETADRHLAERHWITVTDPDGRIVQASRAPMPPPLPKATGAKKRGRKAAEEG